MGNDLADLFDEAAPELTLEEVRDRAFRSEPIRYPRSPRPSVVALVAFVAVLLTGLLVGSLTQPWDRQAPVISQPEIISPDLTDTTPVETTESSPVRLGADQLWPEKAQNDTPSELAEAFATSVLGWQATEDVWALEHPNDVTWVRIKLAGSTELVDVLTTSTPDGNHVIVEAGVPWDHGLDIGTMESRGTKIRLGPVPHAVEGEIIVRIADGSHLVERFNLDPDDPAPLYAELPQIAPSSIRSILIRYHDDTGHVIRVNGTSNPQISLNVAPSQDQDVYLADGEKLLSTHPTVVTGAYSPEPRFDTSDLGEEVTLAPITDVARILRRAADMTYPDAEIIRVTVLGTTPQGTEALVVHSIHHDPENDPSQERYMLFGDNAVGTETPIKELTNEPGGLVPQRTAYAQGPWTPDDWEGQRYAWWHVPTDTSVVVMSFNGEQKWQRPIDATVIFKYESAINIEFTALNSIGETIASYSR